MTGADALRSLAKMKDYKSQRISSWDRTGKNADWISIKKGKTETIAEIEGPGCISHIWITVSCKDSLYPRKIIFRAYWDGEKSPSVEAPLGDFFGVGHGVVNHYVSLPLNMITKKGSPQRYAAMNCFFPMPFFHKARIEIVNECDTDVEKFYYHIDYESYHNFSEKILLFHAQWHRENPTRATNDIANLDGKENYVILDAEGKGHYVGCNLSINNLCNSPFEGDDMIFIDGEKWPPSLHGTGTEDYFCSAWGFPAGKYDGIYHGVSLAGSIEGGTWAWAGKWTMYRYHLEAPIAFEKSIKVTIEHGHANSLGNDYSSVAYWYQTEPHKEFPPILPVSERLPCSTLF